MYSEEEEFLKVSEANLLYRIRQNGFHDLESFTRIPTRSHLLVDWKGAERRASFPYHGPLKGVGRRTMEPPSPQLGCWDLSRGFVERLHRQTDVLACLSYYGVATIPTRKSVLLSVHVERKERNPLPLS